jgi:hypothetical protein
VLGQPSNAAALLAFQRVLKKQAVIWRDTACHKMTWKAYALPLSFSTMELYMFKLCQVLCAMLMVVASQAFAEGPSCTAKATEKKLAGAAKTSFLTKCERDAATLCDTTATERKLHGAARTSFTRKCLKDAVGQAPGA